MADAYLNFTGTAPGRFLTRRLGLPQPAALRRHSPERPRIEGHLLHLTAGPSTHRDDLAALLVRTGHDVGGTPPGDGPGLASSDSYGPSRRARPPGTASR
ncbi:hypothetical protein [Streptomyces beihaiensis]|uniref:Uncharacterized protein n=1 Tax=Streptomyces beihaiensis TaxID=2984495 RepID=A0ABT3TW57_9ACTN|nr:hypothetical protein [Streptomyces beihaiensis]MCX3061269.1 hypothetical protein [Streptomyces beihaiensis]